jgi:hypothetical protein
VGGYVLGGLSVAAAIGRCFAPDKYAKQLDWQFVLLIVAAGVLLFTPVLI